MNMRNRLTRLENRNKFGEDDPLSIIFVRSVERANMIGDYAIAYIIGVGSIMPLPGESNDEFEARAKELSGVGR